MRIPCFVLRKKIWVNVSFLSGVFPRLFFWTFESSIVYSRYCERRSIRERIGTAEPSSSPSIWVRWVHKGLFPWTLSLSDLFAVCRESRTQWLRLANSLRNMLRHQTARADCGPPTAHWFSLFLITCNGIDSDSRCRWCRTIFTVRRRWSDKVGKYHWIHRDGVLNTMQTIQQIEHRNIYNK